MKALSRLVPALGALLLLAAAPPPGVDAVTAPVHTYSLGTKDSMLYPTSVAVDTSGRVWVADGANDRVLLFGEDGTLIQTVRRVAGAGLSRPMAVATSTDGRVWIADAGNNRIVALGTRDASESAWVVDKKLGKVDLTDVEVSPDAKQAWTVDNDGNRVLSLDVATGRWDSRGAKGSGAGSFNHPRSIALGSGGRTFVGDVLNGRVQRFDASGKSALVVVKYGVSPGQVFRPSGIDVADGRLWVADSVMGVVQVFTEDGVYVDAIRDASGNVAHFNAPIGVDVLGDKLYVVEARGAKVTELAVMAGSGAALKAGEARTASSTASQGQECTLCHLDLIAPLDAGVPTALVSVPKKDNGQSWAGSEVACLSCHDGAVLDSRRHIWSGYAHPRGSAATIPTTMKIPASMPLVNGEIACRTCHSPHSLGGSAQQHRGATMLRVTSRPSELCVACHGAKGGM